MIKKERIDVVKKYAKGFTLIEILIVVAIIAILASVVLVGLGPAQQSGRDSRRISDLQEVQNAIELYYGQCGYYPGVAEASSPCGAFQSVTAWTGNPSLTTSLTGTPIQVTQVPNDPTAGKNYFYGTAAGGTAYVLGAQLENLNNAVLQQSLGTPLYGVNCSKVNGLYCVTL